MMIQTFIHCPLPLLLKVHCVLTRILHSILPVDGEMKEFVTTEDQNFIMVKRTNQNQAATVHPSGLQLNPAKQPSVTMLSFHWLYLHNHDVNRFVYDGRYDKYIERDDEWEEADPSYGVPVLAACAAILGIGM